MAPPEKIPARPSAHKAFDQDASRWRRLPAHLAQSSECQHDVDCAAKPDTFCLADHCVPICTDSDGGVVSTMAEIIAQHGTPGHTTAYVPMQSQKTLAWKKITATDGCKTPTLLLEHSCLRTAPGAPPHFAYQYIPCPADTTCGTLTDSASGVTGAACIPNSPPACIPSNWNGLGLATNSMVTYAIAGHQGNLFAGGIEGVRCWDPDEATWQTLNTGFAPPLWGKGPMVVDLASHNDALYSVMVNGGVDHLYRLMPELNTWALIDAPSDARSLFVADATLYLGHAAGVDVADATLMNWTMVGAPLASTVKTMTRDGTALLAGTFDGDVRRFDVTAWDWVSATPSLDGNFIHALQRYGEYLYIGAEWTLTRCWTESGVWDTNSVCEQIEPETGFSLDLSPLDLHVHQDTLYVATTEGVRQYDATNDAWLPMNAGLALLYDKPLHTFALGTLDDTLIVGTIAGVYQWGCP